MPPPLVWTPLSGHCPVQKRHHMSPGAQLIRCKCVRGLSRGNSLLHCPGNGPGIHRIRRHIGEGAQGSIGKSRQKIQKQHRLSPGTRCVRREYIAGHQLLFICPAGRFAVIGIFFHIRKRIVCRGFRTAVGSPQEGKNLSRGTGFVGCKKGLCLSRGDSLLHRPDRRIGVIGIGGHIRKRGSGRRRSEIPASWARAHVDRTAAASTAAATVFPSFFMAPFLSFV